MDTMKIMLGTTIGLLLALVVLQFTQLGDQEKHDIQELRAELARQRDAQRQAPAPTPEPAPATQNVSNTPDPHLEELRAELERVRQQQEAAAIEQAREIMETPDPAEEAEAEKRRGFINRAILIATVEAYVPDQGFLMLNVKNQGNVRPDAQLAIRRNGGIAGRVRIVSTDEFEATAIAEPIAGSFFEGDIVINDGDELIVPPR